MSHKGYFAFFMSFFKYKQDFFRVTQKIGLKKSTGHIFIVRSIHVIPLFIEPGNIYYILS